MAKDGVLQVLIITGQLSGEHDPKTSQYLRRMLESTGRFQVKITEEFRGATAETLAPYDLALLNYDGEFPFSGHDPVPLGRQAEQALLDFVRAGKGLIFHHSAIWNSPWPKDFHQLMGGYCAPELGSRKNPRLDFEVKVANTNHPITAGLDPSWNTVQEDFFAGIDWHPEAKVEVLETIYDDVKAYTNIPPHIAFMIPKEGPEHMKDINKDIPVAWINHYGKGRAFVITIGHGIDTMRRPGFVGLYCRAAEYAATGEVRLAPPDLKGENRRRAWPYYSPYSVVEYSSMIP